MQGGKRCEAETLIWAFTFLVQSPIGRMQAGEVQGKADRQGKTDRQVVTIQA
jgi:hypothetical protein